MLAFYMTKYVFLINQNFITLQLGGAHVTESCPIERDVIHFLAWSLETYPMLSSRVSFSEGLISTPGLS